MNGEEIGSNAVGGLTDNFLEALPPAQIPMKSWPLGDKRLRSSMTVCNPKATNILKATNTVNRSQSNQASIKKHFIYSILFT